MTKNFFRNSFAFAAAALFAVAAPSVHAAVECSNGGFESGDLTDWTSNNLAFVQVVTSAGPLSGGPGDPAVWLPQEGAYFGLVSAGQGANVYTTISQTFNMSAGDTLSFDVFHDTADYIPFLDDSFCRVTDPAALVTTIYTRDTSQTGDYGAHGWVTVSFLAGFTGNHTVECAIRNTLDNALTPQFGIDNLNCATSGCDLSPIEAKLDDETRFTSDAELATIEAKLDDGSRFTSNVELNAAQAALTVEINQNETAIGALEVKLDTGSRFTSDAELAAAQTALTTEINQNETAIGALEVKLDALPAGTNALEVKLDTETRFTDDAELSAAQTALTTEINQNEAAVAAVEVKLDTETRFTDDAELAAAQTALTTEINQNEAAIAAVETKLDALPAATSALETKLDTETRFTDDAELAAAQTALTTEINQNETAIAAVETKLDTETRFTDDAELAAAQTALTTEINQNEAAIAAVEVKLDTEARFTDDAELAALQTALTTEINQNETAVAAIETKLDDEVRFTSDQELADAVAALTTEANQNEAAIAVLEAKFDAADPQIQESLCAIIDLLLTPERRRCSDTMGCGFGFFPSGLESVSPPACATAPNSGQFAPTSGFTADAPASTHTGVSVARGGSVSAEVLQAAALARSTVNASIDATLRAEGIFPVYVMPAANGGALDQVAEFVAETIRFQKALAPATDGLFRAEDAYAEAERLRKEGRYPQAYLRYRDAYRGLVTLLQNVTSASTTTTTTTTE